VWLYVALTAATLIVATVFWLQGLQAAWQAIVPVLALSLWSVLLLRLVRGGWWAWTLNVVFTALAGAGALRMLDLMEVVGLVSCVVGLGLLFASPTRRHVGSTAP